MQTGRKRKIIQWQPYVLYSIYTIHNKQMNGRTISKQRLRQFSEEGFEQAADDIQVLPSLWRQTG